MNQLAEHTIESLYDQLARHATQRPDAPFLVEAETGATLTYAQTFAAVRASQRLLGRTPRMVHLSLPNGIANAVVWLAALTGGHMLVPLAPDAPAAERARLARRYAPDTLVVECATDAADFTSAGARVVTLDECERVIARAEQLAPSTLPPDAALEGYVCLTTSGSTGEPKGVILSAGQIAWTARHIRDAHQLMPSDRGLTVLPFSHVNAPVVSLCASLAAGSAVVIAQRFSRSRFWEWVERYQITWASVVPTVLAMLLQTEKPAFLPGALRFVRTASAPLPLVHLKAFERRFAVPVVETYGLSEAAATVAANPVPPGRRKPGSVGLPVGVALRICRPGAAHPSRTRTARDDVLCDIAPGEIGEVCIAGPSVIAGYAGQDAQSQRESFVDGWFRTGDLGYLDAEGYLYLTGRLRDVIIRGGENIAPREVEETLLAASVVEDVAVVGAPDPIYGQRVVAYIVPAHPWSATSERMLRAHCATRLSPHKIPDAFIAVEALPRTRSGKLARQVLQAEMLAEQAAG